MSVYEFGPFQIDAGGLLLLHRGEPVSLGPKVVETLLALVEHPGFVEEANLAQNIYVLRKALRAHWDVDAIETVPRRGYRFTAPVRVIERIEPSQPLPSPVRARRSWWIAAGGAAAAIAVLALGIGAAGAHRANPPALSAEGARDYQIGRYYWNLRTRAGIGKSLAYFAKVVDSDPRDARGYAGLAQANAMMGDYEYGPLKMQVYFERAKAYAERAIALDPHSGDARATLGLIAMESGNDASAAIAEYERAIADDPANGPAHEWYGIALMRRGDLRGASAQLKIASDLDPLSVATAAWLGSAAYLAHRYDEAIAYSREAFDLSPALADVLTTIGKAREAQGRYEEAIAAYSQFARARPSNRGEAAALLAHAYALAHRPADARSALAYARAHASQVEATDLAAAAEAVGERGAAIAALRKVRDSLDWIAVRNDPRFDTLRAVPAFQKIAAPA
jgi:DNA-binding winged helix-turn-helix (wHTH) protein/tetratricopeptide (TPR) repeat protein